MNNLNRILKTFTKTISNLESLSNKNNRKVEVNEEMISFLNSANSNLIQEAERADKISSKLKEFIS